MVHVSIVPGPHALAYHAVCAFLPCTRANGNIFMSDLECDARASTFPVIPDLVMLPPAIVDLHNT